MLDIRDLPGGEAFADAVGGRMKKEITRHPKTGVSSDRWEDMGCEEKFYRMNYHLTQTSIDKEGRPYACVSDVDHPRIKELRLKVPQLLIIQALPDNDPKRGTLISTLNEILHEAIAFLNTQEGAP